LNDQFNAGRLYAVIASRPGQSGRCDGYILEGKELEFYLRKIKVILKKETEREIRNLFLFLYIVQEATLNCLFLSHSFLFSIKSNVIKNILKKISQMYFIKTRRHTWLMGDV
jgi:hypothetical protein